VEAIQRQTPVLESIESTNGIVALHIGNLGSNRNVCIERTWSLDDPAWTNVADITSTGLQTNWSEAEISHSAFYRLAP
jgi:hypothetical protein